MINCLIFSKRWCVDNKLKRKTPSIFFKYGAARSNVGGIIQAVPLIDGRMVRRVELGLIVDPRNKWRLISTTEAILGENYDQIGLVVPQRTLSSEEVIDISSKLAWACAGKGIIGFVSMQLLVWKNEKAVIWSYIVNLVPLNCFIILTEFDDILGHEYVSTSLYYHSP